MKREDCLIHKANWWLLHRNIWWWGQSLTVVHKEGIATIDVCLDNSCPKTAYAKNLSVFSDNRRKGLGTELLALAEDLAKRHGRMFIELSADKNNEWLVAWYEKAGYVITQVEEHEYRMTKIL